jgi:5-methylcytosine-specific restriction endonuclease McrA
MNLVLTTQTFSYRQSILANKERVSRLTTEGDRKQSNFHKHKRKMYLSQKGLCIFCKRKTFLDSSHSPKSLLATKEHVKPKGHGGTNAQSNLKISCSHCNNKRGSQNFDKFMIKAENSRNSKFGIIATTGKKAKKPWSP